MDADVYGPSIPTIMGAHAPPAAGNGKIVPVLRYGIEIVSIGFFVPKGEATIWRGHMLSKVVERFLGGVEWGELDYLLVDLPPGTGDVQLSLCQMIPLTGANRGRVDAARSRLQRGREGDLHVQQASDADPGIGREHERFRVSALRPP